jgi:outer membrane autotransporter protein
MRGTEAQKWIVIFALQAKAFASEQGRACLTRFLGRAQRLVLWGAACAGLTVIGTNPGRADFIYWLGTASTDNWNTPANWSTGNLPGTGGSLDTTVVAGSPFVPQPVISSPTFQGYLVRIGDATAAASPSPLVGALTIDSNGSLVLTRYMAVGYSNNSNGLLNVTGPNASLTITDQNGIGALYVALGNNSVGTVNISGGASVSTVGFVDVAGGTGSVGTVTVDSSTLSVGSSLFLGDVGNGSLTVSNGNVTVGGSLFVGNSGQATLTIANGGQASAASGVTIAQNAGSTGSLIIGAAPGSPPAAPGALNTPTVTFGAGAGDIVFNHTDTTGRYVFAPSISGVGAVNVYAGTTVLTGSNTYSGSTMIQGGTLAAGGTNVFSAASDYAVMSGGTMNLQGFDQTLASLSNAGTVLLSGPPGTKLTIDGNYVGNNGTLVLHTYLGTDGSPSDQLIMNGGTATGTSFLRIINAGGPGAETTANGIQVVSAINGGTTAPGAFALTGEARGGEFDYFLYRGGLNGSDPNDWFLRSDFVGPGGAVDPIIGPELATYGVVQPVARQVGQATLGTLHERIGDTLALADGNGDGSDSHSGRPDWGRFFGQQINNRYQAFADPRASGGLFGFQGGLDLWRGSVIPNHRDIAGVYFAYSNAGVDVNGLITNPAATNYILTRTGAFNVDAYSAGAYWTHYGPGNWYVDAVLQGTLYEGHATTQFANLPTRGYGFISSLEAGDPIPLPSWLGPKFVLEPQAQILWQQTAFNDANDGLGPVGLGTTSGWIGRLGVRGQWTIAGKNGQVWQPYFRANIWRDWTPQAVTTFDTDPVPLIEQATWTELAGGVTAKLDNRLSLYAQAGYQFALSQAIRRDGVKGDIGLRYAW